ncbi:MAG: hypothetical protein IJ801_04640 [Lachnospiraceae bacterium]|nr:hypothetical protein [Lachnospiraceae bacterium]
MKIWKHVVIILTTLFCMLGIPLLYSGYPAVWLGKNSVDALSSASVIVEQPSGEYLVFVNRNRHRDEEALQTWIDFFEGREISWIFEDISCCVAKGDHGGLGMAQSYQSRLPENQMTVRQEDAVLMLSKAEAGRYDVIVMSKEAAEAYHAQTLCQDTDTEMLTLNIAGGSGQ